MAKILAKNEMYRAGTCREAVLVALETMERGGTRTVFDRSEIVQTVLRQTTDWPESTIETTISSTMYVQSGGQFKDLDRQHRGRYRLQDDRAPWRSDSAQRSGE